MRNKRIIIALSALVFCLGFLYLVFFYNNKKNIQLKTINLSEFETYINSPEKGTKYIYIGRDSCPTCNTFYPALSEIVQHDNLNIVYYNTEQDRKNNPEEMYKLLDSIGVGKVPSILQISDEYKVVYSGEEFLEKFK